MAVAVIGGGASGMISAIFLARGGVRVSLFEKNEKLGKKLYITGKGRCNLTNDCDLDALFENVVHGQKYLFSALSLFSPADTMGFFEGIGVPLKVERGRRVFPASGKSSDVIRALSRELSRLKVDVRLSLAVTSVQKKDSAYCVATSEGEEIFDRVIIATGGVSYPATGSTGDGYEFARRLGHSVVKPVPALCALKVKENISRLDGLALKNVRLAAYDENGKEIASEFGEATLSKSGIAGPAALSVSSYTAREKCVKIALDLKPALDESALDKRLIREFEARKGERLKSVMRALTPEKLNLYVLSRAGVDGEKLAGDVLKAERSRILKTIKALSFTYAGQAPFEEAVITSGGVDLSGLKPTGESRSARGLYFVGEVADVDALTGGYNLQIAWATGVAAAYDILKQENK